MFPITPSTIGVKRNVGYRIFHQFRKNQRKSALKNQPRSQAATAANIDQFQSVHCVKEVTRRKNHNL